MPLRTASPMVQSPTFPQPSPPQLAEHLLVQALLLQHPPAIFHLSLAAPPTITAPMPLTLSSPAIEQLFLSKLVLASPHSPTSPLQRSVQTPPRLIGLRMWQGLPSLSSALMPTTAPRQAKRTLIQE